MGFLSFEKHWQSGPPSVRRQWTIGGRGPPIDPGGATRRPPENSFIMPSIRC